MVQKFDYAIRCDEPVCSDSDCLWTYFIQAGTDGPVKIGVAKDVEQRIKELQTGCPDDLRLIGRIQGNFESELHQRFSQFRVRGEWFNSDIRLLAFIVEHAESCGQIEGLIVAAKGVVRAFDGMRHEILDMWFKVAAAYEHSGPCPWPHARAFDNAIESLRKCVKQVSK